MRLPIQVSDRRIIKAAFAVWHDRKAAIKIGREALAIIVEAHDRKPGFFYGKSSKRIISGLFFLLGYKYDAIIGELELANQLGTTEVTLRKSYRNWLDSFPDLFKSAIFKLKLNPYIRKYIHKFLHDSKLKATH